MSGIFGNNKNSGNSFFSGGSSGKSSFFGGGTSKSGGLFGQSSGNSNSGGAMFGSSNPSQGQPHSSGSGFFGSSNTGGSPFGRTGDNKSSSFFGSNNKSGGFFGNSGGGSSSGFGMKSGGTLFGSGNNSSSTFGAAAANPNGGLFGSKSGTSGGSFFGNSTQSNSGSSFFGGSNNPNSKSAFFGTNSSNTNNSYFESSMKNNMSGINANLEDGTVGINFSGLRDKDHGNDAKNMINLNTLTANPSHKDFSLEELRLVDYFLKKQGKVDFPIGAQPKNNSQISRGGFGSSNSSTMFGGGNSNSNNTGTFSGGSGLNNSQKTSGFMSFGSNTKPSGLFGSTNNDNKSSGLFGTGSKPSGIGSLQRSNASSSLFGSSKPTNSSSGLFGNSGNTTPTFGAKTNTSSTLFGSTNSKPSGGLFGGSNQGKSVFGASSSGFGQSAFGKGNGFGQSAFGNNSGNSMFGNKNNISGGNIFFGNNQQNGQNSQHLVDNSFIQAYSTLNLDPYGLKSIEGDLNFQSIDFEKKLVLNKIVNQVLQYHDQLKDDLQSSKASFSIEDPTHSSAFTTMPIKFKLNRRGLNDEKFYKSENMRAINDPRNSRRENKYDVMRENELRRRTYEYKKAKLETDDHSKYSQDRRRLRETVDLLRRDKSRESGRLDVPETEQKRQKLGIAFLKDRIQDEPLTGPDVIRVKISIFVEDGEELLILSINKKRTVNDLKVLVIEKLKDKYSDIQTSIIKIVHKSRILSENNTLESSGAYNGMTFDVLVQEQPSKTTRLVIPEEMVQSTSAEMIKSTSFPSMSVIKEGDQTSKDLVIPEKIPISSRSDYKLYPSLIEMARMTEDELSKIKNLSIENIHGKVTWPGHTDARKTNFDEIVTIEPYSVTVYPEELESRGEKPIVGLGLNKPAIIELYQIKPPTNMDEERLKRFEESLKKKTTTMEDAEFLSYNHQKATLNFKVAHFTKYSFIELNNCDNQSDKASAPREEQNADISSLQKNDQSRFSFNPNQPKPVVSATAYNADLNTNQDEIENEMEVDGIRKLQDSSRSNFLEKIEEDSESKVSSMPARSDEFQEYEKRSSKLQYGELHVKEFEDESYQEHDLEQEEEDEISYRREDHHKSLSEIREEIQIK